MRRTTQSLQTTEIPLFRSKCSPGKFSQRVNGAPPQVTWNMQRNSNHSKIPAGEPQAHACSHKALNAEGADSLAAVNIKRPRRVRQKQLQDCRGLPKSQPITPGCTKKGIKASIDAIGKSKDKPQNRSMPHLLCKRQSTRSRRERIKVVLLTGKQQAQRWHQQFPALTKWLTRKIG